MAFKIRRGTNAERLTITPAQGELIYTTDTKKLYVGDGTTVGGVAVDQGLATTNYVDNAINNLVDGAASTLDTLKELADALGSDPDFATNLATSLSNKADLSYVQTIDTNKADISSLSTVATSGDYGDLLNLPTIPSITGLASETYVDNKVSDLVNGATSTLDTLKELAEALGNDQNFATTVTNSLANKANVVDLSAVATSGDYADLLNVPFTPNLLNVGSDILPSTDVTYDLGSPTKRFKDLYLSNNTLYLGDDAISVDNVYGLALKQPGGGEGYGAGYVAWTDQDTLFFGGVEVTHPLYGYLEKLSVGDKIKELAPGDADFTLTVTGALQFGPDVGGFKDVTVPVDQSKSQDNVGGNYYVYVVEFIKPVNNFNNLENSPLVANSNGWYDIDPNGDRTLGAQYIRGDAEVNIRPSWDRTPTVDFKFLENGTLQLPSGGDIVDSTGTSVLGGGGSGVQGTQGLQGLQGGEGGTGLQGLPGVDGSQGVQGLQGGEGYGLQGLQGADGSQGPAGNDGSPGITGNDGAQGLQGLQGTDGLQGPAGADGSGGGGTTLPADAVGYLRNDGSGTLSWTTSTVTAGTSAYSDVWIISDKNNEAGFWTEYTLTGTFKQLFDWQGNGDLTLTNQTVYGREMAVGSKVMVVNDASINSNDYGIVFRFPSSPAPGDTFSGAIGGDTVTVTAGNFVVGRSYTISTVGTTNFTLIGASNNSVGVSFTATGVGTGNGTAYTAEGVGRRLYVPAAGQRAKTIPSGNSSEAYYFGPNESVKGMYTVVGTQMDAQPVTWVYVGVIDGTATWYQMYF